jgi:hypothetical protein
MKRVVISLLIILMPFVSCKKEEHISFCEGISPAGEKMKCGTKFTTGDLTAVVEADKPFETDSLKVTVHEIKKFKEEPAYSFPVTVKPEEQNARFTMSFYNEGKYRVLISDKDENMIAEGTITIIDTY